MKRLYEGMFLFDANETAKRWSALEDRVGTILRKNSAELRYAERWPDQKLAYEIGGARKGTYYLTYFEAPTESIQPLRRDAELSEEILRVMVLHEPGLEEDMNRRREVAARRANDESNRAHRAASAAETTERPPATASGEGAETAPATSVAAPVATPASATPAAEPEAPTSDDSTGDGEERGEHGGAP